MKEKQGKLKVSASVTNVLVEPADISVNKEYDKNLSVTMAVNAINEARKEEEDEEDEEEPEAA